MRAASAHPTDRRSQPVDLACAFGAALLFYGFTLAPGVVWGDSATLAIDALQRSITFGTAGDHPLFVLAASVLAALPGDVAHNVNFTSAVFGALAVMLVFRCGRLLGASRLASATGAAALAVSHAFWLHSVIAEVYTANAFFLAAVLNLLLEWRRRRRWTWLAGAAVVFAVGLTNHLILAAVAPAAVLFIALTGGRDLLTRRALAWTAMCTASLAIAAFVWRVPTATALRRLWWGPPGIWEYLNWGFDGSATAREAAYYAAYLLYQFPTISIALVLLGAWTLLRERPADAWLLLLTIVVNAAVFVRHTVWPSNSLGGAKFVFYISDYVVFAMFCAVGADRMFSRLAHAQPSARRLASAAVIAGVAVVPPVLYAAMPWAVKRAGVDLVHARQIPYRDNERFFLNPNKRGEDGARRFGREALDAVKPRAVIFGDYTPASVIAYLKSVEKLRPDVSIRHDGSQSVCVQWLLDDQGRRRPTYVAALTPPSYYDFHDLTGAYDLVPAGPIIEVRPRDGQ